MTNIALQVENLSKRYRIGLKEDMHDTLASAFLSWIKAPVSNFRQLRRLSSFDGNGAETDVIWALKDVSFEVKRGEVLGIIGRNGAGKSTLLKILSQITEPTSGHVIIDGRVASLLEVGTGFHPELTGRENVYLNGTILGMTKREIDHKFDEIVAFSEVEKFIDTPVKRYSSGMRVRLAFAVAAHLEPEILLVDEVLAVGDAAFQRKCMGKMEGVASEGRTVLFVSHNMGSVVQLCQNSILLVDGKINTIGPSDTVVNNYLSSTVPQNFHIAYLDQSEQRPLRLIDVAVLDKDGNNVQAIPSGEAIHMVFDYETSDLADLSAAKACIHIVDMHGQALFSCLSSASSLERLTLSKRGRLSCLIPNLPLLPGEYEIRFWCKVQDTFVAQHDNVLRLRVIEGDFYGTGRLPASKAGPFLVEHEWKTSEP